MTDSRLTWSRGDRVRAAAVIAAGWVALLWLLEVADVLSGHALDGFGIVPRTPSELVDVVPAAFVHFGFSHVAANSVPLLVLGFLAALGGIRRFLAVCALIVLADGLGVWLVSPAGSNTAGASGGWGAGCCRTPGAGRRGAGRAVPRAPEGGCPGPTQPVGSRATGVPVRRSPCSWRSPAGVGRMDERCSGSGRGGGGLRPAPTATPGHAGAERGKLGQKV